MQKICSVNETRATFMFRPSFRPAPTHVAAGPEADQQPSLAPQASTSTKKSGSRRFPALFSPSKLCVDANLSIPYIQ